jgi:hypothetical protein
VSGAFGGRGGGRSAGGAGGRGSGGNFEAVRRADVDAAAVVAEHRVASVETIASAIDAGAAHQIRATARVADEPLNLDYGVANDDIKELFSKAVICGERDKCGEIAPERSSASQPQQVQGSTDESASSCVSKHHRNKICRSTCVEPRRTETLV